MNETNIYGGKGNSLITLKNNKLPVPSFFIITYEEAKSFFKENNIDTNNQKNIPNKILNGIFPKDLEQDILNRFQKLNTKLAAVRSSAADEDGTEKSFAGQYNSYLNITEDKLLTAIKECWASYYNDSVTAYRENTTPPFLMSVIVQEMIEADYAGVAFSFNPTIKSDNYYYTECCKGTGDSLVSGEITPSKYEIRRETKKIDSVKGDDFLTPEQAKNIADLVKEIETIYKCPIDIEWCLKDNKLYVVQARPITAYQEKIEPIKNMLTRNKRLWQIECYCEGEYFGIREMTNNLYFQNPILHFVSPQKTQVYYTIEKLEEYPGLIFRDLGEHFANFIEYFKRAEKTCSDILKSLDNNTWTFDSLYQQLLIIYPFETLGNISGRDWGMTEELKEKLHYFRDHYDSVYYRCEEKINNYIDETTPEHLKKYISVLSTKDLKDLNNVNIEELEKRLQGFIYYQGIMYDISLDDFCKKFNYYIEGFNNNSDNCIKGDIVYPGKIQGYAKIIFAKEDFYKFKDGDIIVSSMTTPKFMSIMRRASGFITDEGGVTCHAAIVSRELKKPCLINCGNATSIIKDGDLIELDTFTGIAKIIKR